MPLTFTSTTHDLPAHRGRGARPQIDLKSEQRVCNIGNICELRHRQVARTRSISVSHQQNPTDGDERTQNQEGKKASCNSRLKRRFNTPCNDCSASSDRCCFAGSSAACQSVYERRQSSKECWQRSKKTQRLASVALSWRRLRGRNRVVRVRVINPPSSSTLCAVLLQASLRLLSFQPLSCDQQQPSVRLLVVFRFLFQHRRRGVQHNNEKSSRTQSPKQVEVRESCSLLCHWHYLQ